VKPLDIEPGLQKQLDAVRAGKTRLSLFGADATEAQTRVRKVVLDETNRLGATTPERAFQFEAGRELARLLRAKQAEPLYRELRLWLRKWRDRELDFRLLQSVLSCCLTKLCKQDETVKRAIPKLKRRTGRTYEQAVAKGSVPAGHRPGEQVEEHRKAAERSRQVSDITREVLRQAHVPMRQFVRYNAFALQVERYTRKYLPGTATRAIIEAQLLDLWEAKALARPLIESLVTALRPLHQPSAS
jgi:hypothetical protein